MKGKILLLLISAIIVPVAGYNYISAPSGTTVSITRLYNLNPQPGETVAINITISDVSLLVSCYIDLAWDPNALKVTTGDSNGWMDPITRIRYGVYEGPFLKEFTSSTFFLINKVDNEAGAIQAIFNAITAPATTASGSGVIATLNFTYINPSTTTIEITGHSLLYNSSGEQIQHQDVKGLVTSAAPPGIWTELWFPAAVGFAVVEIMLLILISWVIIKWWRSRAEAEIEETTEIDVF